MRWCLLGDFSRLHDTWIVPTTIKATAAASLNSAQAARFAASFTRLKIVAFNVASFKFVLRPGRFEPSWFDSGAIPGVEGTREDGRVDCRSNHEDTWQTLCAC